MKAALLAAAALLCLVRPSTAQTATDKAGDPRVAAALAEIQIKYEVDADGDFKILLKTEGDRTQLVWVISHTESYGNLEIREVYSPAFKTGGDLSKELAQRLLRENSKNKLGAWRLIGNGQNQLAVYADQISATLDAPSLRQTLKIVMLTADAMEKEITGKDDL